MGCGYSKLEPDEERGDGLPPSRLRSEDPGGATRRRAPSAAPATSGILVPQEEEDAESFTAEEEISHGAGVCPPPAESRRPPRCPPPMMMRSRESGGAGSEEKDEGEGEEGGGKRRSVAEERGERKRKDSAEREEGEGVSRSASLLSHEDGDLPGSPSFRFYFTAVPIRDSADDEEYLIPAEKTSRKEMHSRLGRKDSTDSRASEEGDGRAPKRFRGRGLKVLTKGTGSVYALFKVRSSYGGGGANNSSSLVPEKVA
ncbi:unnamed protein product [Spirodela intermedia]|uniref:Uncharacterized protein n=1 Tax=Spirodela intermedia TaxID=51605 RepID=A0A7I8L578_SPIIN|nr:unnamed protein product [Spirodela intermedia]